MENLYFALSQIRSLDRPMDVPDRGLVCDLLWSDPDEVKFVKRIFRGSLVFIFFVVKYGNLY